MARQINLINPAFRRQKRHFSAAAMAQGLAAMAVAVILFAAYLSHRVDQAGATLKASDARVASQRDQLLRFGKDFSPQGRSKLLEDELVRAQAQLKSRQALLDALRVEGIGGAEGFSAYLAAFARQSVSGVWLTGISLDASGEQLGLEGRVLHADLVPVYLRALGKEDVMRGRQVASLKLTAREPAADAAVPAKGPARYVEFTLSAPRSIAVEGDAAPAGAPKPAPQKGSS
jgi:hypothetical protein